MSTAWEQQESPCRIPFLGGVQHVLVKPRKYDGLDSRHVSRYSYTYSVQHRTGFTGRTIAAIEAHTVGSTTPHQLSPSTNSRTVRISVIMWDAEAIAYWQYCNHRAKPQAHVSRTRPLPAIPSRIRARIPARPQLLPGRRTMQSSTIASVDDCISRQLHQSTISSPSDGTDVSGTDGEGASTSAPAVAASSSTAAGGGGSGSPFSSMPSRACCSAV